MHLFHCHVQYFLIKTKKEFLRKKIIIESICYEIMKNICLYDVRHCENILDSVFWMFENINVS